MTKPKSKILSQYYSVFRSVKLYFSASWISILIILIVMLLLTQMGQGTTIIIDLFSRPLNLLITMLLTLSLALVLSHYPDYLEKNSDGNEELSSPGATKGVLSWDMPISLGCVGLIEYYEDGSKKREPYLKRFDFLKRLQSVLLFWAIAYVLLVAYQTHINPNFNLLFFNIIYLLFSVGFYALIYRLKKKRNRIRSLALACTIVFWLKTLVGAFTIWFSYRLGWHPLTFFAMVTYVSLANIWYSLFRNIRFNLQFYSFSRPLNLLSNNRYFLLCMSIFGWFALAIFVISQFQIVWFNPVVIILTLLYTTYGLIIHPIKHKLYYAHVASTRPEEKKCILARFGFLFLVPIGLILLSVLVFVSVKFGNELHKLHPVAENEVITEQQFKEKLYAHLSKDKDSTIYFIASYGGGLTANAWNSLILDTLSNFKGKNILESTVAMSGVSGGAMGQGIYSAIYKNHTDPNDRKHVIQQIDQTNFISLDISWMFGWDFVREWFIGRDSFSANRSKRSMMEYERIVKDHSMSTKSFRAYWAELFRSNNFFPAQIVNTASTHSTRGVSCSVLLEDFQKAFPAAENVLQHSGQKSLSFSDALSTSNRFPLLSPAAKIEGYGHFVDGGYFENSGMLSVYNFYQYLSTDSLWDKYLGKHKVVFIQIMNSKSDWINEIMPSKQGIVEKTRESGEVAAVINTIVSIDKFPRYFNALLKNNEKVRFAPISLPYRLTEEDFNSVYRATNLRPNIDSIIQGLNNRNAMIRRSQGSLWQTAEPPLARLLSIPAYEYMKAVIAEGNVLKEVDP